jgi:hypothetical protein
LLADRGAYDAAIATVQPIEEVNRQQYSLFLVNAETRHKDAAAIAHTLPSATRAVEAPTHFESKAADFLSTMTLALATAGFNDAAQLPYKDLEEALTDPSRLGGHKPDPARFAGIQAVMGDLPGALATADRAGPLTAKPSTLQ